MRPANRNILVVDDDSSIREMIAQVLEEEGYGVVSATNGAEALAYLKSTAELPCCIVLDLKMPIMDGAEFRTAQQQDARLAAVPVLLLTANQNNQTGYERMGVTDVLHKPIKLTTLLDAVRHVGC